MMEALAERGQITLAYAQYYTGLLENKIDKTYPTFRKEKAFLEGAILDAAEFRLDKTKVYWTEKPDEEHGIVTVSVDKA